MKRVKEMATENRKIFTLIIYTIQYVNRQLVFGHKCIVTDHE